MDKSIIIENIDTKEAEKNFLALLKNNETLFLNGEWGSGKTEFLNNISKKRKIILLDLWRIKDDRTVANITFSKLFKFQSYIIKIFLIFCIMVSILMTNVINLGLEKKLNSIGLLRDGNFNVVLIGGVIALFVTIFQILKVESDSIYIFFLSKLNWIKWSKKVLVVDDFDRIEESKQLEAYKVFNILNGKLPIIFVGDYAKIAKNEDNYLQKIIDRQVELPYNIHPQSIWEKYFLQIEAKFDFVMDHDLKKIFVNERRNLREQKRFNDYVNHEFIVKGKLGHVQINQQLFIIYLYLFHKKYYLKLLDNWFPTMTMDHEIKRGVFDNKMEEIIDTLLYDNYKFPDGFKKNKQGYILFENISNLSENDAKRILSVDRKLKNSLIVDGQYYSDFYKYITYIFNSKTEEELISNEDKVRLLDISFNLLKNDKYSALLGYIVNEVGTEWVKNQKTVLSEADKEVELIKYYEDTYLFEFDISQRIYLFLEIIQVTRKESIYNYYINQAKEIISNSSTYNEQKNKPFLLSLFVLRSDRSWIEPKNWNESIITLINKLNDGEYILFWSIYRLIKLQYEDLEYKGILDFKKIKTLEIIKDGYDNSGNKADYSETVSIFEERVKEIADKENLEVQEIYRYDDL